MPYVLQQLESSGLLKTTSLVLSVVREKINMKSLAVALLLSAVGIISTASNVTVGEQQDVLDAPEHNATFSPRGMKSADWNSDEMTAPLANPAGGIRSLENLLEVFNPQRLARQWDYPRDNLTKGCGAHVNHYLTHLHKAELWALKSE